MALPLHRLAVAALVAAALAAPVARAGPLVCIAPSSATLVGMSGNEAANAVDQTLEAYLAGPMLTVARLQSRLVPQARLEAAAQGCTHLLFTTVRHQRRNSGLADRLMAGALYSGASQATGLASSAGGRVLASATAGAAGSIATATHIRTRDRIDVSWRLEDATGRSLRTGKTQRNASVDGEDLLTPMVEDMAVAVVDVFSGSPVR